MEEDIPSKHEDKKIPILDMKVWIDERGLVVYEHFEKPAANRQVIHASSAQSAACKRSVHVNEVVRRILNTSSRLEWSSYTAHALSDYFARMKVAGYNEKYRKRTLQQGLRIFDKMLEDARDGVRPVHRPKNWQPIERRRKKRDKKQSWATKNGCVAPIIIPSTPNSELLHMLREVAEAEAEPGVKFNIIEKGGMTVKRMVQKSNPTATGGCVGGDCLACKAGRGKGGACRKSNVVYEIACNQCPEDRPSVYIGETARNLYTRGREHTANYNKQTQESFMKKHQEERHNGAPADFQAKVKACFKDCLSRQVAEGVYIRRCENEVLNSKSEWHQPPLWSVRNELTND